MSARHPLRALLHVIGAFVAIAILVGTTIVLVDAADGDFASTYQLSGSFPSAGEGLHPGSEVQEHGVQIGSVHSISLVHGSANVVLSISDQYRIPRDAVAIIRSQNLFGAEEVSVSIPAGQPSGGYLPDGGIFAHTRIEDELGQLFAAAGPLLSKLDTTDLSSLVSDLSQAAQGEGPAIARSLDEGTRLADLLSATSAAQLRALDSFTRFSGAIATIGPAIDGISQQSNVALPVFTQAASAYQSLLTDLAALSNHVSALLAGYRPDIATILSDGGNVTRVLVADQSDLEQLIYGLYQYAYRFAHGASPAHLADGSRFGFFKTFVDWVDVEKLVCGILAPASPGLSFLAPLQQAVSAAGSPLNCSSEIAAFNRAQGGGSTSAPPPTTPPVSKPVTKPRLPKVPSPLGGISSAAQKLVQQLYEQLAAPAGSTSPGGSGSIGSYVQALLGAS